jgi:hypothetical protein
VSKDKEEVFPTEFRHEVVTRFAKQLIDGSIKIDLENVTTEGHAKSAAEAMFAIVDGIRNYFAHDITAEKRSEVEHQIFGGIAMARATGIIQNVFSQSEMEKEVERLHSKIDSTNSLLADILKILKELLARFDSQR